MELAVASGWPAVAEQIGQRVQGARRLAEIHRIDVVVVGRARTAAVVSPSPVGVLGEGSAVVVLAATAHADDFPALGRSGVAGPAPAGRFPPPTEPPAGTCSQRPANCLVDHQLAWTSARPPFPAWPWRHRPPRGMGAGHVAVVRRDDDRVAAHAKVPARRTSEIASPRT